MFTHGKRHPIVALAGTAGVVALALGALAGCSALPELPRLSTPVSTGVYGTAAEAEAATIASTADSAFELPPWLPRDATNIRFKANTSGPGAILHFTLVQFAGGADCTTGTLGAWPDLDDSWWPNTLPTEGLLCGDWNVVELATEIYAWTSDAAGSADTTRDASGAETG